MFTQRRKNTCLWIKTEQVFHFWALILGIKFKYIQELLSFTSTKPTQGCTKYKTTMELPNSLLQSRLLLMLVEGRTCNHGVRMAWGLGVDPAFSREPAAMADLTGELYSCLQSLICKIGLLHSIANRVTL